MSSFIRLSWKKFTLLWEHESDGGVWNGLFPLLEVLTISNSASREVITLSVTLFAGKAGLLKAFFEGDDNHCSTLEVISDVGHCFCTTCCHFQYEEGKWNSYKIFCQQQTKVQKNKNRTCLVQRAWAKGRRFKPCWIFSQVHHLRNLLSSCAKSLIYRRYFPSYLFTTIILTLLYQLSR